MGACAHGSRGWHVGRATRGNHTPWHWRRLYAQATTKRITGRPSARAHADADQPHASVRCSTRSWSSSCHVFVLVCRGVFDWSCSSPCPLSRESIFCLFFFFKQKTAYEIQV